MSEEDIIIRLKRKRGVLRSAVTKISKKIESELAKTEVDLSDLEENLEQLINNAASLKVTDDELEKVLKLEDIEKELESALEYQEKIVLWKFRATKQIRILNQNLMSNESSSVSRNSELLTSQFEHRAKEIVNIKLPKLSIPKFYGDISQWLTFWNSFEAAVHKNESLEKIDKFNYLKAHLGGTAASTITGFALSNENYDSAIKLLEDRFGRKDVLINAHMSNLLNISPLRHSSDMKGFRRLFDSCLTQIRSLESLGIISDTYGGLLCPLLIKLLPTDLILEYNKRESVKSDINDLIDFLSKELNSRERASATQQKTDIQRYSFSSPRLDEEKNKQHTDYKNKKAHDATAAGLFSASEGRGNSINRLSCVFCNKSHESSECGYASNLSFDDKKSVLFKKGACYRCLKTKHLSRNCNVKVTCSICGNRHLAIMCWFQKQQASSDKSEIKTKSIKADENSVLTNQSCSKEVYLQTLVVRIKEKGLERFIRIIIDSGSQKCYISKYAAKLMKLKSFGEETVTHGLFGGVQTTEKHKRFQVQLSSMDRKHSIKIEVMDQRKICASIPKVQNLQCINELKNRGIFVSDITNTANNYLFEESPNEIHLLIGADVAGNLLTGNIEHLSCGLIAVETRLGWTIMGKIFKENEVDSSLQVNNLLLSLHVDQTKISDLWNLDSLGISDPIEKRTKAETQELALKHFQETVTRDETGRYQVCLPWLEGHLQLSDHKNLAEKRLKNTVRSLNSINKLEAYQEVFNDWEKEGVIEQINPDHDEIIDSAVHYLPHRAVIKEHSTTKIRPVFDGSAKTRTSASLNDSIEKGPNLIELIPSVLNRFRWGKIGVVADIRRAFLQISLHENDRNFLRFLWWKDGDPHQVITYRHCRVVFGVSASPFLLAAVLTHLLDQVKEPLTELAKKLKNSMYVDNCVTSVNSVEELDNFRSESQKLLKSAKFDLRGWRNSDFSTREKRAQDLYERTSEDSDVQVLGLSWNIERDTLSCDFNDIGDKGEPITKRKILSVAHRIFDPIGFTCPVTLIPKLLLQECWKIEASWDSNLPDDIIRKFDNWRNQLTELKNIKIPRRLSGLELNDANLTLHVFCDASKTSYATCIFLRAEKEDKVTCQLIQARSRVSPLKGVSIPRLELLACSIGARLAHSVKKDLNLEKVEAFYWSDSMDALYWIKKEVAWATFVSNRVREIRNLSPVNGWNYVPGNKNPADLPSRGCSVKTLIRENWWEGPLWLKGSRDKWPDFKLIPDERVVKAEMKKIVVSSINEEKDEYYHHISSYKKIIRVTGWIYRFFENTKKSGDKQMGELVADELKKAERVILKKVQKDVFFDGTNNRLKSLPTITDADGLLRVKTKVFMRADEENFRLPIVLPADHNVVKSLIIGKHKELGHAGTQSLMVALREDYWILKSRRNIKRIIKTCVICQRFSARPPTIPEGLLPEDRVKDASVFEIIGVDVAGPLLLKNRQKTWILILTCAVYRAVHFELLTALSTDNFLLALRRFIARRGRPLIIYSDNGTNFVGAGNLLKSINLEKLKAHISPITWKFIPPAAPWWGGFWERLVGLMKRILRKILGRASLNYEEMATVLCDCENLLNLRPLTYVSDDVDDLRPITPAMFLQENRSNSVADLDQLDKINRTELSRRLIYRLKIMKDIRARFRVEYLGQLQQNYRKNNRFYIPKVGDIVLVWTDNVKRTNWPLGKILEVYPSRDGRWTSAIDKNKDKHWNLH